MEIIIIIGLSIIGILFFGYNNGKADMNYNPYEDHNFKMGEINLQEALLT